MGTIRTAITICLLCLVSAIGSAEPLPVQRIEGEIRAGMTIPFENYLGNEAYGSFAIGLELRYNFKNTGWDCGIVAEIINTGYIDKYFYGCSASKTLAGFSLLGEYNFRQGHKVNPYAGMALGLPFRDDGNVTFLASPRIGVEFLHHIRISAQLNISRRYYNNACVSIGIVFGGRPKNPK